MLNRPNTEMGEVRAFWSGRLGSINKNKLPSTFATDVILHCVFRRNLRQ